MFIINWGEIEQRIVPKYYTVEKRAFYEKIKKCVNLTKLKNVIKTGTYGILPPGDCYSPYNPVKLIRATEMKEDLKIDYNAAFKVPEKYVENTKVRINNNDILVAVKGATIASNKSVCYVEKAEEKSIVNGSIFKFSVHEAINSKYIAYLLSLDILKKQMKYQLVANNAVDYLDKKILDNLYLILPEPTVQAHIVKILDEAHEIKRQKLEESNRLLDSINDYLLSALGVKLPLEGLNTLSNRLFYVQANNLLGGRFDPRKYSKKYKNILEAIQSVKCDRTTLKSIIIENTSGNWGLDETTEDPDLISCLTIRGTEFDNKFNLDLDNNRTKFRKYKKASFNKIELIEKDILIEKSGGSEDQPVGRVAFIEKEMLDNYPLAFSNFIHRIRIDEKKAVPEYVFEYLRLMHNIKITEVMQTQTNGIRNLIMQEYFNQTIILPELEEQKEFATHAMQMRKRAYELKLEAEEIVSVAKQKVEQMLLENKQ